MNFCYLFTSIECIISDFSDGETVVDFGDGEGAFEGRSFFFADGVAGLISVKVELVEGDVGKGRQGA